MVNTALSGSKTALKVNTLDVRSEAFIFVSVFGEKSPSPSVSMIS